MTTGPTPVIIVGAPRSGTSLMQHLIRETPPFASVPRESDVIWLPYCHPANNDWQHEGCPTSRINDKIINDIRTGFSNQALSAATWRLFHRLRLMQRPRLATCLRLAYRFLSTPWSHVGAKITPSQPGYRRLVDKSVHAGLWLNLVDAVFPDALYIHMVRSPVTCIPSMIRGWTDYTRFCTYRIPESVAAPRPDTSNYWCFPLPPGWHEYYEKPLVDICAFQWRAVNDAILSYLDDPRFSDRTLRIHLENLTDNPKRELQKIIDFAQIQFHQSRTTESTLPMVNSFTNTKPIDASVERHVTSITANTYDRLTA